MKSFFTLLTTAFVSLSGYAYFDQTKLSISTSGSQSLRIMVDGKKYTNKNGDFSISNLPVGYHTVKIFMLQRKRGQGRGQYNGSQSYYHLVYNNNISIRPMYQTDIMINRFGKVFIDEQPISAIHFEEEEEWSEDGNDQVGFYQPMNTQLFELFKQSIRKENFDDNKLSIAKQVISANWFNTAQVKEIVSLFVFESSKLDIAKYMYKYTLDKGSYFLVNDAFTFSNTKQELMNFIQKAR